MDGEVKTEELVGEAATAAEAEAETVVNGVGSLQARVPFDGS